MSKHKRVSTLIKELTGKDKIIAIPRIFRVMTGDFNRAALLQQIVFWSDKSALTNGWFWKTDDEWFDEIGLSNYQLNAAISGKHKDGHYSLRELGVKKKRMNNPAGLSVNHYSIDEDVLAAKMLEFVSREVEPNSKNLKLEIQKTSNSNLKKLEIPYTEITTENTAEHNSTPPNNIKSKPVVISENKDITDAKPSHEYNSLMNRIETLIASNGVMVDARFINAYNNNPLPDWCHDDNNFYLLERMVKELAVILSSDIENLLMLISKQKPTSNQVRESLDLLLERRRYHKVDKPMNYFKRLLTTAISNQQSMTPQESKPKMIWVIDHETNEGKWVTNE